MRIVLSLLFCLLLLVPVAAAAQEKLPDNLEWLTNETDPSWASPDAQKGGTYRTFFMSFPLTLRIVGPDSNSSFAGVMRGLDMGLTDIHPNTGNIIPSLATHWAYGDDNKTVYYKLDPDARWSDGEPVTADDYIFTLEFMRSKFIVAPWYNQYYTEQFDKVIKYDDYTIAVVGKHPKSHKELHYYYGLSPMPRHFYKLDDKFVRDYNWKIPPNTGPYDITKIKKGRFITLERKKDWWGKDKLYNKHRFNVDKIRFSVIRDMDIAYEHFLKGKFDSFPITAPAFWHEKATGDYYDKGYIDKLWFYNDCPQVDMGMWLNQDDPLFKDINVRLGFSYAMNIHKVIQNVLRGDYERANTNSEGYGEYTNDKIRAREFDLKKADEYLTKAGWGQRGPDGIRVKDGQRLVATVTYGQPHHTERLLVLKDEAKKAGIDLELQLLDPNAAFKKMLEKKHQIAWSGWSASYRPQYYGQYHSDNAHKPQTNNFSNTADPEMDKLIDTYRNEFDEKKKCELACQIQQKVFDDGAYIPTFTVPYFRVAYWRYWKLPEVPATKLSEEAFGLLGTTGGLFWLDKKAEQETRDAMEDGKSFPPKTIIADEFRRK